MHRIASLQKLRRLLLEEAAVIVEELWGVKIEENEPIHNFGE